MPNTPWQLRALAIVLALTAAGTAAFWATWFLTNQHHIAQPECYRVYENTFPLPDTVLAGVLLALTVALWQGRAAALFLGGVAGGMLLYLAGLDTLYNLQHTSFAFDAEPSGIIMLPLVIVLWALALALFFLLHQYRAALLHTEAPMPLRWPMRVLIGLAGVYAIVTIAYWWHHFTSAPDPGTAACAAVFHNAFGLADLTTLVCLALAILGSTGGRGWGFPFATAVPGGIAFGTLNYTAFALQNPDLIAGQQRNYAVLIGLFLAAIIVALMTLWRNRGHWFTSEGTWTVNVL